MSLRFPAVELEEYGEVIATRGDTCYRLSRTGSGGVDGGIDEGTGTIGVMMGGFTEVVILLLMAICISVFYASYYSYYLCLTY